MIDAKDPRSLAAVLDVDVPFAERIQHAVADIGAAQSLSAAVRQLPLGEPVARPAPLLELRRAPRPVQRPRRLPRRPGLRRAG